MVGNEGFILEDDKNVGDFIIMLTAPLNIQEPRVYVDCSFI